MTALETYLRKALQRTYLRKHERLAWLEEMQSHLEESLDNYRALGLSEAQAQEKAIQSFGSAKELRRRIVRETFGIAPQSYLVAAGLCFIALVAALFTNMRFDDIVVTAGSPDTWEHIANPQFVMWMHRYLPLNSDRWLVLGVMSLMMLFTRTRAGRVAVLISWIPFTGQMFFISWANRFSGSWYAYEMEFVLVVVVAFGMFFWTRSQVVCLAPWVISISIRSVAFAWHLIQETLWQWTGNPIFWGLSPISWRDALNTVLVIGVQVLCAIAFVRIIGLWASSRHRHSEIV